ncbi:MAG: hypothetical protein B6I36_10465 [Desulfobacteraceae bacterium 4572_35.1]|nr:MAG: hypothetical protein B6I36_10465 [Desulfobacteraceae bacterium 4572_35.1]
MAKTDNCVPPVQIDQRHSLRTAILIKKICQTNSRQVFFGYATNISGAGLFISCTKPAALGTHFNLEFTLPEPANLTISCECKTIWNRRYSIKSKLEPGMGLSFIDLDEKTKKELDEWICNQQQFIAPPSRLPTNN